MKACLHQAHDMPFCPPPTNTPRREARPLWPIYTMSKGGPAAGPASRQQKRHSEDIRSLGTQSQLLLPTHFVLWDPRSCGKENEQSPKHPHVRI